MIHRVKKEVERETGQGTDLWRVIWAPIIWALHFLACYVSAAIFCEKVGRNAALWPIKALIALITLIALLGVARVVRALWKVRGVSTVNDNYNYEGNTPEERHRFLSHVALVLAALSTIAIIFVAMPVFVLSICR